MPSHACDVGFADCRKDVAPYAMVERLLEKENLPVLCCAVLLKFLTRTSPGHLEAGWHSPGAMRGHERLHEQIAA